MSEKVNGNRGPATDVEKRLKEAVDVLFEAAKNTDIQSLIFAAVSKDGQVMTCFDVNEIKDLPILSIHLDCFKMDTLSIHKEYQNHILRERKKIGEAQIAKATKQSSSLIKPGDPSYSTPKGL